MSLQKTFGYIELIIGVVLILGIIIGSYFVFFTIPEFGIKQFDNIAKDYNLSAETSSSFPNIISGVIYGLGSSYFIIVLLISILFIFQGILNIMEE